MTQSTTLLQGIVGSHAYGLNHEGSDIDRIGVFAAPTVEVAGLNWNAHKETKTNASPDGDDYTTHEIAKFLRLVLKCNPTVIELLWTDKHEISTYYGHWLVESRKEFLSKSYVHDAYLGYARAQLTKFQNHEFKPKHARHTLRLLRQGYGAYFNGEVQVRVDNPQEYFDLAEMAPGAVLDLLAKEFRKFEESTLVSPLPSKPNTRLAEEILRDARLDYLI